MNSLASHNEIVEVRRDSDWKTVLAKSGYKISLEGVSASPHLNFTKFTKDGKHALARYVMQYERDEVFDKKNFLPSDLKSAIVKPETMCGGRGIISIEEYYHGTNSIWKNTLIGSTTQLVFADVLFKQSKAKRYSVVHFDGSDKVYRLASVFVLFYLETKTTVGLDKAEFAFAQFFDLTLHSIMLIRF